MSLGVNFAILSNITFWNGENFYKAFVEAQVDILYTPNPWLTQIWFT
jgi:hypothetical protein